MWRAYVPFKLVLIIATGSRKPYILPVKTEAGKQDFPADGRKKSTDYDNSEKSRYKYKQENNKGNVIFRGLLQDYYQRLRLRITEVSRHRFLL